MVFPISKFEPIDYNVECVYNFVLNEGHIINIDNFEAVTLGVNINEDIVKHNFNDIIYDLKSCKGWQNGYIKFDNDCFLKDVKTNTIVGINLLKEIE